MKSVHWEYVSVNWEGRKIAKGKERKVFSIEKTKRKIRERKCKKNERQNGGLKRGRNQKRLNKKHYWLIEGERDL